MKLNKASLADVKVWSDAGITLPKFDMEAVIKNTYENPVWVHFGAGNIFRAFPAMAQQKLLESGLSDKGIIAAFPIEPEVIEELWKPCDNLSLIVTLKASGEIEKAVQGSVTEALYADKSNENDWNRLKQIFQNPSLQIVSFTITEKGYFDLSGNSAMSKLTELCYERFLSGKTPLTLLSMDNCSENGQKLFEAVLASAEKGILAGKYKPEFSAYVKNPKKLSFPWSMIDKITPRPDGKVREILKKDGFENAETIITEKGTYASAFVNAEECEYLVAEDNFPNSRPPLEKAGIIFTDRDTVNLVEKMKVCTCLNPLHTALAVFGCLLSYNLISDEMKDADLKKLVYKLGYDEGMPVAADPKIIDPNEFLREVLEVRLPNPFLPDTPQRIATDTSQKLPVRFGETVKAYMKRSDLILDDLKIVPLVFAGWCRYLIGIDDKGNPFELSPDPLLPELKPIFESIKIDSSYNEEEIHALLRPVLSRADIFGVDLYETPLSKRTEGYFREMIGGRGAVREVLRGVLVSI